MRVMDSASGLFWLVVIALCCTELQAWTRSGEAIAPYVIYRACYDRPVLAQVSKLCSTSSTALATTDLVWPSSVEVTVLYVIYSARYYR